MAGNPKDPISPISSKTTYKRHLSESWAVLPAKTRLGISLAVTAFALAGIYVSNQLEEAMPPSEEDKARLPGSSRTTKTP